MSQTKTYKTYQIDSDGHVYKEGIDITETLKVNCGYLQLDGKSLHRIMMKLFKYNKLKHKSRYYVVDHINQNKLDNSIKNLRYASYRENALNQKPKEYVTELPPDCFNIIFIQGQLLKNPLIYSPKTNTYYRKFSKTKYRIVNLLLTGDGHYCEITDQENVLRYRCINNIYYKRPIVKDIPTRCHNTKYRAKDGTVREYIYQPKVQTKSDSKKTTLLEFIRINRYVLNSIKTIQKKTDYINENIPEYNYSVSMVYKYL